MIVEQEIVDFYNLGAEIGRLERGIGRIEFERTKDIILRYLPKEKVIIYDVGGGIGVYSNWLASLGHEVHLIDLSPNSIEYAKTNYANRITHFEVSDARKLNKPDESADLVLLMGPMYHLTTLEDRVQVLSEVKRVLKKNGQLICAGITRYGNLLWSLSVYGMNNILDEDEFRQMVKQEIESGQHIRPERYPYFIARSYFHLPKQLENEIKESGFILNKTYAVEGPTWLVPTLNEKWEDETSRQTILNCAKLVEEDATIMAMSPHFLILANKE